LVDICAINVVIYAIVFADYDSVEVIIPPPPPNKPVKPVSVGSPNQTLITNEVNVAPPPPPNKPSYLIRPGMKMVNKKPPPPNKHVMSRKQIVVKLGVVPPPPPVPAPLPTLQSNNLPNTQTTTPPPTNNTVSQNPPQLNIKELSGYESISFPSYCSFSIDKTTNEPNAWIIGCGENTKNNARGFMGKILESQGWKFCGGGLSTAWWWKNGVITNVVEGSEYAFRLSQGKGPECETPPTGSM
jgi:hypothetical protein